MKYKKKAQNQLLLANNTRGLITTKQTKPRPVAFAAPHPIKKQNKTKQKQLFWLYIEQTPDGDPPTKVSSGGSFMSLTRWSTPG